MKPTDLIQRLGYLALGTRMKRIGEALQSGVNEAFTAAGIPVQPGQVAILVALSKADLTVGELVTELGLSQPGISRSLGELGRSGLVELVSDASDRRVRSARLTANGRTLMERVESTFFRRIAAAAEQLCEGLQGPLLDQLAALDHRLADTPFSTRIEEMPQ